MDDLPGSSVSLMCFPKTLVWREGEARRVRRMRDEKSRHRRGFEVGEGVGERKVDGGG